MSGKRREFLRVTYFAVVCLSIARGLSTGRGRDSNAPNSKIMASYSNLPSVREEKTVARPNWPQISVTRLTEAENQRQVENIGRRTSTKSTWEHHVEALIQFHTEHGHFVVPKEEQGLYRFVKNLRQNYKYFHEKRQLQPSEGLSSRSKHENASNEFLTVERIKELDAIGFAWTPREDNWYRNYEELRRFHQANGHMNIPTTTSSSSCNETFNTDGSRPNFQKLKMWMTYQRARYINKDGNQRPLTSDQIAKLEEIGFRWTPQDEKWWSNYEELKAFKKLNGHLAVKGREHHRLRCWKNSLRRQCREYVLSVTLEGTTESVHVSGLNPERLKALKELEFCWLPERGSWNVRPPEDIFDGYA